MMLTAVVAQDIKTAVFTTNPEMHYKGCEKKIKGNLRFEKGVKNIITNLKTKTPLLIPIHAALYLVPHSMASPQFSLQTVDGLNCQSRVLGNQLHRHIVGFHLSR